MASPLAPFKNAFFVLKLSEAAYSGRRSPAEGYRRQHGLIGKERYTLVDAFLKRSSGQQGAAQQQDGNVAVSHDLLCGYTIRTRVIETPVDPTWSWQYTDENFGPDHPDWPPDFLLLVETSPERFWNAEQCRGHRIDLLMFGGERVENAILQEWSGPYGDTGIGATLRGIIGDPITIRIEQRM